MAFFDYLDFPSLEEIRSFYPQLENLSWEDIKPNYESKDFEWYEFNDVTLVEFKGIISDERFEQLENLKGIKFSYEELKDQLWTLGFTEEEYRIIMTKNLPYLKSDPTPFPDECKRYFDDWQLQICERLGNIRLTYILCMHYFNKGIPDDTYCDTSGKDGFYAKYFPDFKDGDWLYLYMFHYYVRYLYYQIFTVIDVTYHLINIYYQMKVDQGIGVEYEVVKQLKVKNEDLYTYITNIYKDDIYKKSKIFRNIFIHRHSQGTNSPSVVMEEYFRITDKAIEEFKKNYATLIINEDTLKELSALFGNEEMIILTRLKDMEFDRQGLVEFLKKLRFNQDTIDIIIEKSKKNTRKIDQKIRFLEAIKTDCVKKNNIKDSFMYLPLENGCVSKNDLKRNFFKSNELKEIIKNSQSVVTTGVGILGYVKSKEFKDNIDKLLELLSNYLKELKIKLEVTKAFQ
jgi:hypothetical protein